MWIIGDALHMNWLEPSLGFRHYSGWKSIFNIILIHKMMYLLLALSLLTRVASGGASCRTDSQCNQRVGEVCLQRFNGCDVGTCLCPEGQDRDHHGYCRRRRLGDETCGSQDVCASDMRCVNGRCRCDGTLSPDRTFCLRQNQKLLGQRCNDDTICLQQIGSRYTRNDVMCRQGSCQCAKGFKQTSVGCRKWDIGESGCHEHDQCHGGALCTNNVCQCPAGYDVRAGGTKCTKRSAVVDVTVGQRCNEVHEERYCGEELICHTCGSESLCLQSRRGPYPLPSSSSEPTHKRAGLLSIIVALMTSLCVYVNIALFRR